MKLFSAILILCVGIVAYSNTFHCSFHLDDATSISENPAITNIHDLQSIWNFWPCRFLTYLSFAFNYHINGLNVPGYHLFNLAVHLTTSLLVWWLTLLTFSTPAVLIKITERNPAGKKKRKAGPVTSFTQDADLIALFAGLIFVSHPIQTQAVTYIVQRAASMATMFYVASLCFYVKSRLLDKKKIFYYIGALIAAVMAMFTKETAITLPLMILLYEFSFFRTRQGMNWRALSPFLLTLLIIPVTTLLTRSFDFQGMQRAGEQATNVSSTQYLLTQFRVIATYIRLVFLPIGQNFDYYFPISTSFFEIPVLISFLFIMAILFAAQHLFSKYRLVSFSIFWFFLALLPESSFLPIKDVIFEHRLYLPLVGYSMLLAGGIYYLPQKSIKMAVIVLTMIVACNTVLTYQRNKVWQNALTLWNDDVRKSPHKARPFYNLGESNDVLGNFNQAIADYTKAIDIDPDYADAYHNRGFIYQRLGDLTKSLADYNKAIEINPRYAFAYLHRGLIYDHENNLSGAMSDYDKAIEIDPNNAQAYNNRAAAEGRQGNTAQAIADLTKAIEIDPNYADAYNNEAVVCFIMKEYDKAWDFVHKVEKLGGTVNPGLLKALVQATGRDN